MIPDYQTCMRPVLVLLADGQTWRKRDLVASLEEEFRLDRKIGRASCRERV